MTGWLDIAEVPEQPECDHVGRATCFCKPEEVNDYVGDVNLHCMHDGVRYELFARSPMTVEFGPVFGNWGRSVWQSRFRTYWRV